MRKNSRAVAKTQPTKEEGTGAASRRKRVLTKAPCASKANSIKALEAKLSLEAKEQLEEIRALRKAIGPVPFKVRDLIREIREN